MKAKSLYLAIAMLSLMVWGCNKSSSLDGSSASTGSLKSSLNSGIQDLSSALTAISSTSGYQVLTGSNSLTTKSTTTSALDTTLTNSILLSDINGVYNYKSTTVQKGPGSIMRFFTKSAENPLMIVNLPEEKVISYKDLLHYKPSDTLLVNNYKVTLSQYQYRFTYFKGWDYKMASNINIKSVDAGALKIQSSNNNVNGYHFASQYVFTNGYNVNYQYISGDTAQSVYAITKDSKTLYEEKYTAIRSATSFKHAETTYSFTIGNVQIVRGMGKNSLDSAKVYVAGVLQSKSKITIVDKVADPTDQSITHKKREMQITFDDGTVKTMTELLGANIDNVDTLFTAMRSVWFATSIIDWIAWDIYTKK